MEHRVNTSNFYAFKESVGLIPVLTKEEEYELATNMTEENREMLITSHLRFVMYVVQSYKGYKLNEEDLLQEGIVGLVESVSKFDATKNVRLMSFAVYNIRYRIHQYIMKNFRIAKLVTTKAQRRLFFGLRQFVQENNDYTMQDIAQQFDTSVDVARDMHDRLFSHDVSFHAPLDDEHSSSPELILEAPSTSIDDEIQAERDVSLLSSSLQLLDDRQQQVIRDRWLTEDKVTLKTIASRYGISCERARQIELQALDNLRKQMR